MKPRNDMHRSGYFLLLVALCAYPFLNLGGQQIGQNTSGAQGAATFQTTTQLVVETVSVKDKNGKPVEGLTAKDFTVTEDGVRSEYERRARRRHVSDHHATGGRDRFGERQKRQAG